MPKTIELENLGSLITIKGTDNCLGNLMDLKGRGVFDAEYGRVEVTPEQAEAHNKALEEAMLKGLDENCQVGQGGTFYLHKRPSGSYDVRTFDGTIVSSDCSVSGNRLTFRRKGKTFRGTVRKQDDLFNFRRIA